MHVNIRLFARLRELAGASELHARGARRGDRACDAWHGAVADFPGARRLRAVISCAVNEEYARLTAALNDGDEVAFLPPVSGG